MFARFAATGLALLALLVAAAPVHGAGPPPGAAVWESPGANVPLDAVPPTVAWTRPADGATNVSIGAVIEIAFSEPMDPNASAAFSIEPAVAGTLRWSGPSDRLTFDPALDLAYGTTYTVRIRAAEARDLAGNPLDGNGDGEGGDDHAFSFATEPDTEPPHVLAVTPADAATDVSVTANIEVRFSETMNRTSVEEALSYSDGATTWNGTAGTFAWRGVAAADDTVRFNPHANFPFSRTVRVTLNASLARDPAGFGLDGDGDGVPEGSPVDDVSWAFSTEATDATPPKVTAVDPADGAKAVSPSTGVLLAFSEAMNRTSVEDAFLLLDGVRTYTKANGTFAWSTGDEEFVYTPGTTLAFKRAHTVRLGPTARDVNGNVLDGNGDGVGGDAFSSTFETAAQDDTTAPHVVNTIPRDGAEGVGRVPVISITFDDAMDRAATETAVSLSSVDALTYDVTPIPISAFEWSAADHTVSFRPNVALEWDTLHRVAISQAARDDAGLPLERPYTFAFRTAVWRGTVVGRVVDDSGGVGDATVTLGAYTTRSSATGAFGFPNVAAGRYNLTVAKPGYATTRIIVNVDPADANPEVGAVDLGAISLRRVEGVNPAVLLGVLGAALAAALLVGLWLRRRRIPPWERFEEMEEASGEAER